MRLLSHVEPILPSELTEADLALWDEIALERPDLKGPYFDVRYVRAIGDIVPHAYVARLYDAEEVAGYFAYQRRGGTIMALGAPLTDYHGIVSRPDLKIDYDFLLKGLKAQTLAFQGWLGEAEAPLGPQASERLPVRLADLSAGYEAYLTRQSAQHHKFFKNLRRIKRNVESEFGSFAFSFEAVTPEIMAWVIAHKRDQYERSGLHDVFSCGWTLELLKRLAVFQDRGFGLRVGVQRHGHRVVAAEICLIRGDYMHMWFPAYDPAYSRFAPGIWLALDMLRHAADFGVHFVDFGYGSESYKQTLTEPPHLSAEGRLNRGSAFVMSRLIDVALDHAPGDKERFEAVRLSIRRRLGVIHACEVSLKDQVKALGALGERAIAQGRALMDKDDKAVEAGAPPPTSDAA